MLINFVPDEECRIAIVEGGVLEEYYQERASSESHVSNIYKGRVTNVESSIQAAFVDFGLDRNGFLHISDLHPKYFPGDAREEFEKVGSKTPRRDRPPIQKCLRRGQEVLVQVLKEGIGSKGPTLTSYLSIPGRFLVMMPNMTRLGVSRKVDDEEERRNTRDLLRELDPPDGFGFIVRTAGVGQTKTDLKRDLAYLQRLWKNIERKRKRTKGTGELYTESDLIIRTLRDVFTNDIKRIVIDDLDAARRADDFLRVSNPRSKTKVVYYEDPVPLFHRFEIERQIDDINARQVELPSGGSLVIDQTEALVAIDVNSGKSRDAQDAETNAYRTNQEAVDEICRQLRLRDLGGVIVNDLIDMRQQKHRRTIEQRIRNNLKKDRARTRIGAISQFGILEMTRQRMRPSLKKSIYNECSHCAGTGYVKSAESVLLMVMRRLALVMHREDVAKIELTISPDAAFHLLNRKRKHLVGLEARHNKPVLVRVGGHCIDYVEIAAFDDRGGVVVSDSEALVEKIGKATDTTFRELNHPSLPPVDKSLQLPPDDDEDEQDEQDERSEPQKQGEQKGQNEQEQDQGQDQGQGQGGKRKRRRRRRRRRRSDQTQDQQGGQDQDQGQKPQDQDQQDQKQDDQGRPEQAQEQEPQGRQKNQRQEKQEKAQQQDDTDQQDPSEKPEGKPRRRRRRRRSKSDGGGSQSSSNGDPQAEQEPQAQPASSPGAGYSNEIVNTGDGA